MKRKLEVMSADTNSITNGIEFFNHFFETYSTDITLKHQKLPIVASNELYHIYQEYILQMKAKHPNESESGFLNYDDFKTMQDLYFPSTKTTMYTAVTGRCMTASDGMLDETPTSIIIDQMQDHHRSIVTYQMQQVPSKRLPASTDENVIWDLGDINSDSSGYDSN